MELSFDFDKQAIRNIEFLQKHYNSTIPDLLKISLGLLRVAAAVDNKNGTLIARTGNNHETTIIVK